MKSIASKPLARLLTLAAMLCFATAASAIQPPVVTQPKPGIIRFAWTIPTTRENGSALAPTEIAGYELYLTNEAAVITIPGAATTYDYTVPAGYTTTAADSARMMTVDTSGLKSQPSAAVALPGGITSPKSRPGAAGGITAVRAPN